MDENDRHRERPRDKHGEENQKQKNIFGLVGSATEEEVLAMLKANENMKEARVAVADAEKDQAKDKSARDITDLITTGSEILERLEQLGPSELLRIKIDELHDMFVNADPQGSIPIPNKKTWQEEANLLPIVQAALGRFLTVATLFAPSLLPIPEVPVIYEG